LSPNAEEKSERRGYAERRPHFHREWGRKVCEGEVMGEKKGKLSEEENIESIGVGDRGGRTAKSGSIK
jgi:hypothetical protein